MRRVERKFNQIPIYFLWLCRESQPFFEHRSPHYLSRFMCELQQDVAGLYKEITRLMLDHAFDSKSSYLKYETIFDLSDYISSISVLLFAAASLPPLAKALASACFTSH